MRRLVEEKLPIEKKVVKTSDAVRVFHERGMEQKAELFRYRRASRVNLYELDGYEDYFYGNGACLIEWAELIEELLKEYIRNESWKDGQ